MRHKYATTGIVLARTPVGEASMLITLLTPDLGLVRARAQSIRKEGAKLATALQTLAQSDVILVRGKEGWRLSGAVLVRNWFTELATSDARARAGRTANLLLRLVHGESLDLLFYQLFIGFLQVLVTQADGHAADEDTQDAAEFLAVLRFLHMLGVDAGELPGGLTADFALATLALVTARRSDYLLRINHGIAASGL